MVVVLSFCVFFFSSRRRHTRCLSDWSSDVCSSDLSVQTPPSAYLPETFDPKLPIALIAGKGIYPMLVAKAAREAGVPVKLIAFEDETSAELVASFPDADRHTVRVGQVGR